MRVKEIYSAPRIHVIPMQTENLLETISLPVNNNSSDGGAMPKAAPLMKTTKRTGRVWPATSRGRSRKDNDL